MKCYTTNGALRDSCEWLLRMIALVPESQLGYLSFDPYGIIGDALEAIGQPCDPDPWRALSMFAHGYDCGPPAADQLTQKDE